MEQRIIGLDVARALAVIGMIIVNFKVVFGEHGAKWLEILVGTFEGKASATFVVLAGIALALSANFNTHKQDIAQIRKKILKRAMFLFVVGVSYLPLWIADILHFYGIYMLVILLFLTSKKSTILTASLVLICIYPLLFLFFDYEAGWDFKNLEYHGLWTLKGFMKNLFFNGFHPVLPWVSFMLFGFWFGKHNLNDSRFLKKAFWISLALFLSIQLISYTLLGFFATNDMQTQEDIQAIFATSPMPPMPIYMINGITFASCIISFCILVSKQFFTNPIIHSLHKTGKLALTFYVAHVVLGMGIITALYPEKLTHFSLEFSVIYALLFSTACIFFALIWLKYKSLGPLEWLMKKVIG